MGELTENTPKPLLEVSGKSLLEHKFDALPETVDEVILIVGYLGSHIQNRFGGSYKGKRILYIEQEVLDGTMGALSRAKDILHDRFVVMMGDDIYSSYDVERCIETPDWSLLVEVTEHMNAGGCIIADESGAIIDIEEGNHGGKPGMVSTNLFVLDTRIFQYPMIPKAEGSPEYGLPQTVVAAAKASGVPFVALPSSFWIQITEPNDLARAEEILKEQA
jgi:bifunctional UDP-N-acetylglucosamine pyrophosphorylase/glucosamine-1-phosphate N-acetyltransferase